VHQEQSTPGGRAMRLDRRHVCGPSEHLAIAFDEDDGALHKHGRLRCEPGWRTSAPKRPTCRPASHLLSRSS
jgi:hypothetical protein